MNKWRNLELVFQEVYLSRSSEACCGSQGSLVGLGQRRGLEYMDVLGEQPGEMRVSSRLLLAVSRRERECSWQVVLALKEQEFSHEDGGVWNWLQSLKNVETSFTSCGVSAPSKCQERV